MRRFLLYLKEFRVREVGSALVQRKKGGRKWTCNLRQILFVAR